MADQAQQVPTANVRRLTGGDLAAALAAGWADYRAYPAYGLFFAAFYVIGGAFITYAMVTWGAFGWLVPAAAGFPLLAPFAAVGLYEVSRRRELGLPMRWGEILGTLRGRGDEQILAMGVIVFVAFGFWVIVAHGIFAIFMAESGVGGESLALFATPAGLGMLVVGGAVGGLMALAFFSITVVSLPLLVDRDVDFITAIIASLATMRANPGVMLTWAGLIALALSVAMLPLFLGLLVVLPVLGHATWHLYRRAIGY
jgi:uncharacterized membrane protein